MLGYISTRLSLALCVPLPRARALFLPLSHGSCRGLFGQVGVIEGAGIVGTCGVCQGESIGLGCSYVESCRCQWLEFTHVQVNEGS